MNKAMFIVDLEVDRMQKHGGYLPGPFLGKERKSNGH